MHIKMLRTAFINISLSKLSPLLWRNGNGVLMMYCMNVLSKLYTNQNTNTVLVVCFLVLYSQKEYVAPNMPSLCPQCLNSYLLLANTKRFFSLEKYLKCTVPSIKSVQELDSQIRNYEKHHQNNVQFQTLQTDSTNRVF